MSKHIHAELMALYAQDALETNSPWERWQVRDVPDVEFYSVGGPILWDERNEYRRKPLTSRERFEQWAKSKGVHVSGLVETGWQAWREAERQANGGAGDE